jgi:hypothetical protein
VDSLSFAPSLASQGRMLNTEHTICRNTPLAVGERKVIERVNLNSLAEAQALSVDLSSHGWSRQWQL